MRVGLAALLLVFALAVVTNLDWHAAERTTVASIDLRPRAAPPAPDVAAAPNQAVSRSRSRLRPAGTPIRSGSPKGQTRAQRRASTPTATTRLVPAPAARSAARRKAAAARASPPSPARAAGAVQTEPAPAPAVPTTVAVRGASPVPFAPPERAGLDDTSESDDDTEDDDDDGLRGDE